MQRFSIIELMKWVVFLSLFLTFFNGYSEQEVYRGFSAEWLSSSVETIQFPGGKVQDGLSCFAPKFYENTEDVPEQSDDNPFCTSKNSSPFLTLAGASGKAANAFKFLPQRNVKLFILFHSWKSFPIH